MDSQSTSTLDADMSACEISQFLLGCPLKLKFANVCDCNESKHSIRHRRKIPMLEKWINKSLGKRECDAIFLHWLPSLAAMSVDHHANYLVQTLMDKVSIHVLENFISITTWDAIVRSKYGSRVVEKLASTHNGALVPKLVSVLGEKKFCDLAMHKRGNYVARKLVENASARALTALVATVLPRVQKLGVSPHGSYVIQTILKRVPEMFTSGSPLSRREQANAQRVVNAMLVVLIDLGAKLFRHPNGNFTAQVMIESLVFCEEARLEFTKQICDGIVEYAQCPFGVRVIESVLLMAAAHEPLACAGKAIVDRVIKLAQREFNMCVSTHYLFNNIMASASLEQRKMVVKRMEQIGEWSLKQNGCVSSGWSAEKFKVSCLADEKCVS